MPARARGFTRIKRIKAKETPVETQQGLRDKEWDMEAYLMKERQRRNFKRDSRKAKEAIVESPTLAELNRILKPGAAQAKNINEGNSGSNEESQQENGRTVLSEEAIATIVSIPSLMSELRESFRDTISVINTHENTLLELEHATHLMERKCSRSQFVWKIDSFSQIYDHAASGTNSTIYSPPFETHKYGYKLALSFCPFGDGRAKGKYASLFFCILKTDYDSLLPWPFSHKLTFSVADQRKLPPTTQGCKVAREDYVMEFTPNPVPENKAFIGRPTGLRNSSLGLPRFITLDMLRNEKYLKDDTLYIKVQIQMDNIPKL